MVYLRYLALTALTAVLNVQASVISDYSSEYFSERVSERVSKYVSDYALPTNLPVDGYYNAPANFPCKIMPTCYTRNTVFIQDPCRAQYGNGWGNVATIACLTNFNEEQYVCCRFQ
ncbi:hypothetical protein EDC96DRAFT_515849 [Choanephora cucurbitarum]|nr:hypothetical protein EDC96DRAFT_515849 [Choanephora cucurbitarum]